MIPGILVSFVEDRATAAFGGTRDAHLIPYAHRISGWIVEPDLELITCSVPEVFTRGLIRRLEDNGQFALTVEEVGSHETYQFKGVYVRARTCNDADLAAFERCRERFGQEVSRLFGIPEDLCRAYIVVPSIAITFRVQEIFLQTPGPAAGRRLMPREGKG